MADEKKLSPVEGFKQESNYLRGDIGPELIDANDFFGKASVQLLKNHGVYQQDDRDARAAGRVDGNPGKASKAYSFMVRTKIPGGKLTSDQLLAELDLCDELANSTLRITSRQGLQLHGILKHDLWKSIHRINEVQMSTLAACGDVERNIMCCPAPIKNDPVRQQLQALTDHLAAHLCPRTSAYHELWVKDPDSGEETLAGGGAAGHEIEPIYGPNYLPRKFKTAVGLPEDNCVDLYANDLGLMAIHDGQTIRGYNVVVGGGFGVTPSAAKTWPAVAKRLCYIPVEDVVDLATAIVKVQRDYGDRSDRKVARLKYTIHNMGLPAFRAKVEEYFGKPVADPDPTDVTGFDDHLGWHEQGDGLWFYGLNVENGRIKDEGDMRMKTAFREICTRFKPLIGLTSHQSILFGDVAAENRDAIETVLRDHGVKLSHEISSVRRWSMACVAWPTCGLAITESERALPGMIDQMEVELARLGLSDETFTVRMTGCPNGCSRPYNCDIGIVGKAMNKYTLFVGGRLLGDRLNFIYKDMVPHEEVVSSLVPVFTYFKHARQPCETLGEFCLRVGADALRNFAEEFAAQTA
jgi:sulfite reductase (ferredoxin)